MNLNIEGFIDTLPIVVQGMGGIFIVIGIIFVTIKVLMFFSGKNQQDNQGE